MARKFTLLSKSALASAVSALGLAAEAAADLPAGDAPAGDPPAELDEHGKPIVVPPAGDPDEGPEAEAQVVTVADASAHASEQYAAGRAAANTRWSTVFASAEATANPALAAFLCVNAPDASAESIVGQLKAMPGASAPAAPAPAAQVIPDTNIELAAGDPLAALDTTASEKDPWAESSARVFGSTAGMVTSSDAGPSYMPVTQGGMSFTPPSMPAGAPPTGN